MSYDCELINPKTKKIEILPFKASFINGNMAVGGSYKAEQNVTYNYSKIFRKVLPPTGIRTLDGMTANESINVLNKAISSLNNNISDDYWEATEGNAKLALIQLMEMALLVPKDSVWEIY